MANDSNEKSLEIKDLSGAMQRQTTSAQMEKNEVVLAVNAKFDRLGGIEKIKGYEQLGNAITTTTSSSTTTSTTTSSSSSSSSSTSSTSSSTSSTSSSSTSSSSTTTG